MSNTWKLDKRFKKTKAKVYTNQFYWLPDVRIKFGFNISQMVKGFAVSRKEKGIVIIKILINAIVLRRAFND